MIPHPVPLVFAQDMPGIASSLKVHDIWRLGYLGIGKWTAKVLLKQCYLFPGNNSDAQGVDTLSLSGTLTSNGAEKHLSSLPETRFRIKLAEDELHSQGKCYCVLSHTVWHAVGNFHISCVQGHWKVTWPESG